MAHRELTIKHRQQVKELTDELTATKKIVQKAQQSADKSTKRIGRLEKTLRTTRSTNTSLKTRVRSLQRDLKAIKTGRAIPLRSETRQRGDASATSVTTSGDDDGLIVKDEEMTKLKNELDREKKRRREAEVLLGPEGKRCKKCNPIVVDLSDADDVAVISEQPAST